MLDGLHILIAEDDAIIALNLAATVEDLDGKVIGPVDTVAEALALLGSQKVDAAIIDANLIDRDVTPLALALVERAVPVVVHTGIGLPEELARVHPELPVVMKPSGPRLVLVALLDRLDRAGNPGL